MNVLILSCGSRNKIVQYFKKELRELGNVIATDCSNLAPALYEADKFYIVPKITDKNYLDIILDICKKENINLVMSLIDPELLLLAENKSKFDELRVSILVSSKELCALSFNKWEMYKYLCNNGFKTAKSYIDILDFKKDYIDGTIDFPVFIKPIQGSASIGIQKVEDMETLEFLYEKNSGFMIQEFLNGQEIGADCYIDLMSKKVVSIFLKKKLAMRAGETDKSVSFKEKRLFKLVELFIQTSGFLGQIDIDIFEIDNEYYISEVNPRFGGGYPFAYECGSNHIKMILNNIDGIENEVQIGNYKSNKYMAKFNDVQLIGEFDV